MDYRPHPNPSPGGRGAYPPNRKQRPESAIVRRWGKPHPTALPQTLPTNDEAVGCIEAGDILLWQGDNLVIFYESFATPYRYTRLGKIDNVANLKSTVGTGNVSARLER